MTLKQLWLVLMMCASTWANFWLRATPELLRPHTCSQVWHSPQVDWLVSAHAHWAS